MLQQPSSPPPEGPQFVGPRRGGSHRYTMPGFVAKIGVLIIILLIVLVTLSTFVVYIRPSEYGIKEVKIGVNRGVSSTVYGPGYWLLKPFGMERMHRFPRQIQVLELSSMDQPGRKTPSHAYDRAAKIQTSDGFFVDVDVSILYRIEDPYKLMTTLGPGLLYLTNGIQPKAEPVLKQALGELNTEDFYNSPKRVEKAEKGKEALNAELAPKGLKVDQILIRYFKYTDEIQKSIEAKKLQDQLVFKNQAEARANTEEAATKRVKQEGEMQVKVTLQEGQAYKTEKTADMELYSRKKAAEGELLVKTAEAEATGLKNDAMQLAGSDRKVALEMAKVLQGLESVVVPVGGKNGVNPLDLNAMALLLGTHPGGELSAPSTTTTTPPPGEQPATGKESGQ